MFAKAAQYQGKKKKKKEDQKYNLLCFCVESHHHPAGNLIYC